MEGDGGVGWEGSWGGMGWGVELAGGWRLLLCGVQSSELHEADLQFC